MAAFTPMGSAEARDNLQTLYNVVACNSKGLGRMQLTDQRITEVALKDRLFRASYDTEPLEQTIQRTLDWVGEHIPEAATLEFTNSSVWIGRDSDAPMPINNILSAIANRDIPSLAPFRDRARAVLARLEDAQRVQQQPAQRRPAPAPAPAPIAGPSNPDHVPEPPRRGPPPRPTNPPPPRPEN